MAATDEKYCGYPRYITGVYYMIRNETELTTVAMYNELPVYKTSLMNLRTDSPGNVLETFIEELSGVLKSMWSGRGKNGRTYGLP